MNLTDDERDELLNGRKREGENERDRLVRVAGQIKAAAADSGVWIEFMHQYLTCVVGPFESVDAVYAWVERVPAPRYFPSVEPVFGVRPRPAFSVKWKALPPDEAMSKITEVLGQ